MADALPPVYGPQRRPGLYNLQSYHRNHAVLGHIITESIERWLEPGEVVSILRFAEARAIDLSTFKPANGDDGLYVYNISRYTDHGQWQNEGAVGLIAWQTRVTGNYTVRIGQSRGLLDELYRKRIHRVIGGRFGNLAVLQLRHLQ